MWEIAVITVLLAFAFTFTNGFQDASSIAATFIASRSASPKNGIIFIAGVSLLGAILGGSAVAFTISGLLILPSDEQTLLVLLIGLLTATIWNLITWKYGLPASSTQSLIGGLIGGGIAAAGIGGIYWGLDELVTPPYEITGFVKILVLFYYLHRDRFCREFPDAQMYEFHPAECRKNGKQNDNVLQLVRCRSHGFFKRGERFAETAGHYCSGALCCRAVDCGRSPVLGPGYLCSPHSRRNPERGMAYHEHAGTQDLQN